MATAMQPLLIELGTEELPVTTLPELAQGFFDAMLATLGRHGIAVERGDAKPLYTPRRLALLLPGVAVAQPTQPRQKLGPYCDIALDADGRPTPALLGFAAKAGVEWSALERIRDAKGERFVHRSVQPGAATAALLPQIANEAIDALRLSKPMRWGAHPFAFARPVHWLVALLGAEVVEIELFGLRAGRVSHGHRFMHSGPVPIASADAYLATLEAAHVLADPALRRARITQAVAAAAQALGGRAQLDPDTLEQVNGLTEWPVAVACRFAADFLEVPQEVLISAMQNHQKFFPVLDANGHLSAHFIAVANLESADVEAVRKGYERVIRPRFADARFFYEQDREQGLEAMGEGLKTVVYQRSLGTLADKVERVARLARGIAEEIGRVDPKQAEQAARLAKNDLQSRLVGEFPELQGVAGRYYALDAKVPEAVARAIDESYRPRTAGAAIAATPLGRVLAIAERLDTLVGGFIAGLKPTGNKDPFALRRQALGLARTLIEGQIELDLLEWLKKTTESIDLTLSKNKVEEIWAKAQRARDEGVDVSSLQGATTKAHFATPGEVYDFVLDRLRGYYADQGIPAAHFAAVAATQPRSLYDLHRRLDALGQFARQPEAAALAAANKRIGNLLRKADEAIPAEYDPSLFDAPAERALAEALAMAETEATPALERGDYLATLTCLARLRPVVDAFFEQVMVNVDDPAIRRNRLALLRRLAERLGAIAAIEHLAQ